MILFDDFVSRLYTLCSEEAFKKQIEQFLEFYDSRTVEFIDQQRGEIVVMEMELDPPHEYQRRETSMTKELLIQAKDFSNEPWKIIGDLDDQRLKQRIREWSRKLERAELIGSELEYLKSFPEYFEAINLVKNKLDELRLTLSLKGNKRGKKSSLSPVEQAKIILCAEKLLKAAPALYSPRAGATVSDKLKDDVTDELKSAIPKISKHKVARLLLKHYHAVDKA